MDNPTASPSIPSKKFMALVKPTIHNTVRGIFTNRPHSKCEKKLSLMLPTIITKPEKLSSKGGYYIISFIVIPLLRQILTGIRYTCLNFRGLRKKQSALIKYMRNFRSTEILLMVEN